MTTTATDLTLDSAMLYVRSVAESAAFYQKLGFDLVDEVEGVAIVAAPGGGHLKLHPVPENGTTSSEGINLYFAWATSTLTSNGPATPASSSTSRPRRCLGAPGTAISPTLTATRSASCSHPPDQDHDLKPRDSWPGRLLAEGVGFEPTVGCPTHALQACRFGRSRIPPGSGQGILAPVPPFHAAAGSCATAPREPSQGREAAALSGSSRVPQIAWPLRRTAGRGRALASLVDDTPSMPVSTVDTAVGALEVPLPALSPPAVRRGSGPGPRHPHAAQRGPRRARDPRVPLQRAPRARARPRPRASSPRR